MNETWSPVAVVGAGALGCFFGGMLARAGAKVTLIGRRFRVEAIARDGLLFESRGRTETLRIPATGEMNAVNAARLILFCVKSTDTDDAARAMAPFVATDAVILSLQNGVNNVERIRACAGGRVLPVLVYAAAEMAAPGHVRHTGGGNVVIGPLRDARRHDGVDRRQIDEIAAFFGAAGVPVRISDEIEVELWTKLVMNCAYNAISALCEAQYGEMVALPEIRAVMREAVAEVAAVAAAKGVRLPADIGDAAIRLADSMPVTVSSTAQDMRRGRRTEIDHLNGYVVREGEALGIATPVNGALNALIRLTERGKASAAGEPPNGGAR
jgi:2-dehydropantoate 2-reductase